VGLENTLRVAVVQMDVHLGQVTHNLQRILVLLEKATECGAQLVVFPECALSGYCFDSVEDARRYALPAYESPSSPVGEFVQACIRHNVIGVLGFLELASQGAIYNSAAIAARSLHAPWIYRKTHLPTLGVDRFIARGERLEVCAVNGVRLGPLICYDARFPEAARVLTLRGAQVIVLPTNWPEGAESAPEYMLRTRARENGVFILAANRIGIERGRRFIGRSQIVSPDGMVLAQAGDGEEILYADITPTRADTKRIVIEPGAWEQDTVGDRRPELYGDLTR